LNPEPGTTHFRLKKGIRMNETTKLRNTLFGAIICFVTVVTLNCSGVSTAPSDSIHSPQGTTTTFILIRHAERAKELGDSYLTQAGRQRAEALVSKIGEMDITAIYSPDRGRNRETVQPLANHLSLTLNLIPEKRLTNTPKFADDFVKEVMSKHAGGMVVWVGNKSPVGIWGGNLEEIYLRLGGTGDAPGKYDDLFIIKVPDTGPAQIIKTTYGKPAGRFDQ
jgi:hypothetical protein